MPSSNGIQLSQITEAVAELQDKVLVKKTAREMEMENLLDTLAKIGGKLTAEEDILFQGTKLILPETMELREAIRFLNEKMNEDERTVQFDRQFNYRPWDGANATMAVLKRAFGAMTQRGIQSFFGEQPPELKTIPIGPNETTQVPWGRIGVIHLPGLDMYLDSTKHAEYGQVFHVVAQGPRKYRFHVEGIFSMIEAELKANSIYRGKAFDGQKMPQFLDLSGVDPSKVIYSDATMEQLDANLWSVLRWPEVMQELGMPLKRAVLLEGPYGTGKTLAAYLTAKVAVENGWSFLLCRPGQDNIMDVMATARLYQPSVVFFEDVDVVAGGSDLIPRLLDVFDGVKAKGTRIMCVLTTNHVEKIHKGMMRPGRLDAVIQIGALDPSGLRRMVEAIVPEDLLDIALDWEAVTKAMAGFLPAFAKESIDRAMRYNVARNQGKATELSTQDFVAAAKGLRPQLELMEGAKDSIVRPDLDLALGDVIRDAAEMAVESRLNNTSVVDDDGDTRFTLSVS